MFCPSKFIVITVHPSGASFANPTGEETKGIEGELKPGETQQIAVMFCPSKFRKIFLLFFVKISLIIPQKYAVISHRKLFIYTIKTSQIGSVNQILAEFFFTI